MCSESVLCMTEILLGRSFEEFGKLNNFDRAGFGVRIGILETIKTTVKSFVLFNMGYQVEWRSGRCNLCQRLPIQDQHQSH